MAHAWQGNDAIQQMLLAYLSLLSQDLLACRLLLAYEGVHLVPRVPGRTVAATWT